MAEILGAGVFSESVFISGIKGPKLGFSKSSFMGSLLQAAQKGRHCLGVFPQNRVNLGAHFPVSPTRKASE